jgi:hypothetical protein
VDEKALVRRSGDRRFHSKGNGFLGNQVFTSFAPQHFAGAIRRRSAATQANLLVRDFPGGALH